MENAKQRSSMRVLMLPLLAHGHITPFLELAKKLTHKNFHIYFCSTPVILNSIKPKLYEHPNNNYSNSIELVELHLSAIPELSPQYHTTKGLPRHFTTTLMEAFNMSRPNFTNILETLKPDLVIYDIFPPWVSDVASSLNIPSVVFIIVGASFLSCVVHHLCKNYKGLGDFPFPEVCPNDMETKLTKSIEHFSGIHEAALRFAEKSDRFVLARTCKEMEGKYIDYLSALLGKQVVPTGFPVQDPSVHDDGEGMDIINWLNKKEKLSTVLVSFGSEYYLSKEEMEDIGHGLELSNVNFIWVVRFPEGEKKKLEEALPDGFLERVRERGMVVEDWAPQIKILKHSSIGGFVSHCGWGSVTESIKFGLPIIGLPMQFDQPWNAKLVEELGIGLEVKRDNTNGRLERETVAKIIKLVVVEKTGEHIRRKAKEMSNHFNNKGDKDLNEVVKLLLQLDGPIL